MLIGTYQTNANRALTLHEPSQELLKELGKKREREKERERKKKENGKVVLE